jgi:folylpolyglutamate synthase/dihydropteroate synthase
VYDKVCAGYTDRPAYFKFLTILAFNIFWKEKVDVAIIEGKL